MRIIDYKISIELMQHSTKFKEDNFSSPPQLPSHVPAHLTAPQSNAFLSESDSELSKRQFNIMQLEQLEENQSGQQPVQAEEESEKSSAQILVKEESEDEYQRVDLDSDLPPHCGSFLIECDSGNENSSSHELQPQSIEFSVQQPLKYGKSDCPDQQTCSALKLQAVYEISKEEQKISDKGAHSTTEQSCNQKSEIKLPQILSYDKTQKEGSILSEKKQTSQPSVNGEKAKIPINVNSGGVGDSNKIKCLFAGLFFVLILMIAKRFELSAAVSKIKEYLQIFVSMMFGAVLVCLILLQKNMGNKAREEIGRQEVKHDGRKSKC